MKIIKRLFWFIAFVGFAIICFLPGIIIFGFERTSDAAEFIVEKLQ